MAGFTFDPREPRILSDKEIATIRFGMDTSGSIFIHESMIPLLPSRVKAAVEACKSQTPNANVVRIKKNGKQLGFLFYPGFDEEAHPSPVREVIMNLNVGTRTTLEYSSLYNPPVLLRKDKLISKDHPKFREFRELREIEEEKGLLPKEDQILLTRWQKILREKGIK